MKFMLGARIKEARLAKGYTQKSLAEITGISNTVISNWENDINKPDADSIAVLCTALDVHPGYFFDTPDPPSGIKKSPDEESEDEVLRRAERLYTALVGAGFVKQGEDITTEQLEVLDAVSIILSKLFDSGDH